MMNNNNTVYCDVTTCRDPINEPELHQVILVRPETAGVITMFSRGKEETLKICPKCYPTISNKIRKTILGG